MRDCEHTYGSWKLDGWEYEIFALTSSHWIALALPAGQTAYHLFFCLMSFPLLISPFPFDAYIFLTASLHMVVME